MQKSKWGGGGGDAQGDQNFLHHVLPLSLLPVVVPAIMCLFFCKLLHNVAIFVAISPGCCNLGNPSFRSLFSHIPYISYSHRFE